MELDALIVGHGLAGGVLAHELGRAGWRILVVDRGEMGVVYSIEPRAHRVNGAKRSLSICGLSRSGNAGMCRD